MRYAINNWVYNDEPLRDTFARLAKYGYDGVELKGEVQQYDVAEVKALCKEFKLQVTSVLGWNIYPIPGRDLASAGPAGDQRLHRRLPRPNALPKSPSKAGGGR